MTHVPEFRETGLPGCLRVTLPLHADARGRFVKTFHAPSWAGRGLGTTFGEDFFSVSKRHVLRGFHVVTPPRQGSKVVHLIDGRVLDAVLDLRRTSPTWGQTRCYELDADVGDALILPAGVAHAFLVVSETAIVGYKTESTYDSATDCGVHWASTPVRWPVDNPVVSERDQALPPLDRFDSPFT